MTLCVAVRRENGVDIYADTRVTGGGHGTMVVEKIFQAHGAVFCFAGTSDLDALFCAMSTPRKRKGDDFAKYFNRNFATVLEDVRKTMGDQYSYDLIAVKDNNMYVAQGITIIMTSCQYVCIGSGADAAYGALNYIIYKQKSDTLTDKTILDVFRCVEKHDETVGYPVDKWELLKDGTINKTRIPR